MTPSERWSQVNDLFHRALEHPPEKRLSFVQAACDDEAIVQEVVSLLAAHDASDGFIEPPSLSVSINDQSSASLVGCTVGHYRIVRVLGEGGMGVVYLAEDMRLGREVALKALPSRYTTDDTSRQRLRREARAAAALAHPGIATVYALEEFDGAVFIAFEYVPGETLREELRRGPLPVPICWRRRSLWPAGSPPPTRAASCIAI